MKKHSILLFLVSTLTLFSCSSDDDVENNGEDKIIGTWVLVDLSPSTEFFSVDECSQASTITLNQDNTASGTFYAAIGNCEPQDSEGTWSNEGSNKYILTIPFLDSQEGTVLFEDSNRFTYNAQGFLLTFEKQ